MKPDNCRHDHLAILEEPPFIVGMVVKAVCRDCGAIGLSNIALESEHEWDEPDGYTLSRRKDGD